jgi:hypothetical protein
MLYTSFVQFVDYGNVRATRAPKCGIRFATTPDMKPRQGLELCVCHPCIRENR